MKPRQFSLGELMVLMFAASCLAYVAGQIYREHHRPPIEVIHQEASD